MLQACLLASDTLEVSDAIHWVVYWLRWFEERTGMAMTGDLRDPSDAGAIIERLYFDGPGTADWTALARIGDSYVPALCPNLIFIPN